MNPASGVRRRSPPSSEPRSSNWPAWSRSPRDCTSPTGPARTWPDRPSPTASWSPSARARSGESCTTWTCSPTAPATGRPPASTPSSRSGPRKCFGATAMRNGWPARASGRWPSMRCPTSRSWSDGPIRRADPGLHRAAGVRVHPARDGQPAAVPDRPHGPDGGRRGGDEGRRALYPGVAGLSPPASGA